MNQSRTMSVIPNHEERRDNKMLWSIVLNAAERSKRRRHDILRAYGIDEAVMDIRKIRFGRVVLCTSLLTFPSKHRHVYIM